MEAQTESSFQLDTELQFGDEQAIDQGNKVEQNSELQFKPVQQPFSGYPYKLIGKIIASYPKKQRVSKDPLNQTPVSDKTFETFGTGFLIGKNLVLTVGHNVYQRQYQEYAQQVTFYPATQENQQPTRQICIKAQKFQVFREYKTYKNEHHKIFDIALIILQDNEFFNENKFLNIKWSYKRWEMENKNFQIVGYPHQCTFNNYSSENFKQYKANSPSDKQSTSTLYYRHNTVAGHSGAPLFVSQKGDEPDQYSGVIGLHKAKMVNTNYGITFNTFQNTQQMVLQLLQSLGVERKCNFYKPSFKKLKQLYEQQEKDNQNLEKQIKTLVEQNNKLRAQIETEKKKKTQFFAKQGLNVQEYILKSQYDDEIKQLRIKINELESIIKTSQQSNKQLQPTYFKVTKQKIQTAQKGLSKEDVSSFLLKSFGTQAQLDKHYNQNKNREKYKWCSIDWWKKYHGVDLTEEGFFLIHWKKRVKMQEFIRDKDWNHLELISFYNSEMGDAGWRLFVDHAHLFTNLKVLSIGWNEISEIKEGDLDRFKQVQYVNLDRNILTSESITALKRFKEKNPRIQIQIPITGNNQWL